MIDPQEELLIRKTLTVIVLTAGVLGAATPAVAASPDAAPSVSADGPYCALSWNDNYTAGITCVGGGNGSFRASAQCKNGQWARGETVALGYTSYAYCSSLGSSLYKPVRWNAFVGTSN
ncbi:hypothetical protein [Longispora albida]|uniref:hypothetical protein n=1 Tax=Longispora albida TaxID=203523 RepID=UPI0012FAE4DA|nr:hypothetical protein [Longispora albida]